MPAVKVESFEVTALRGDRILFSYYNQSDQISRKLKKKFATLRADDKLYFYDLRQDFEPYGQVREYKILVK